jgi:hypothetical protein
VLKHEKQAMIYVWASWTSGSTSVTVMNLTVDSVVTIENVGITRHDSLCLFKYGLSYYYLTPFCHPSVTPTSFGGGGTVLSFASYSMQGEQA